MMESQDTNELRARKLGLDTQHEAVAFVRTNSSVCKSEGFSAHARVRLTNGNHSIVATLYKTDSELLDEGEVGLSDIAWRRLGVRAEELITLSHPRPFASLTHVRGKIFGTPLNDQTANAIIEDIVAGRYSDIHISSFLTACTARQLSVKETISLTRAMVNAGDRMSWTHTPIADKHCVGGLPGNRTTPIIVAICSAIGLTIPKTSSRAITSPSGTADTMETLTHVSLSREHTRRVVEDVGGCFVWGGAVNFSPADDALIRIERALDLDSEGQLVASVLSKKIAAGATHVVIDIPTGPTAKVRTDASAHALKERLERVAREFNLKLHCEITDGSQPVGRGIGPALEARDIISVLTNQDTAPVDLKERSCLLAGRLLELVGTAETHSGNAIAHKLLKDGRAWTQFQKICEAQGGLLEPPRAAHLRPILAPQSGCIARIDNRRLAKVAKLAGAPDDKAAGVDLHVRLGDRVEQGQPIYTIHTETPGELAYVIEYVSGSSNIIEIS